MLIETSSIAWPRPASVITVIEVDALMTLPSEPMPFVDDAPVTISDGVVVLCC